MAKTAQAVIETKVKDGASSGFRNMQREMDKTAKRGKVLNQQFRFMRGGLGQVGHQVQDVAVQLQMGQNAMLVFGQQGSQIASLFGPGGALLGAVLAVGAALSMALLPRLFGATKAAKDLKTEMKNLADNFDTLTEAQKELVRTQVGRQISDNVALMRKQQRALNDLTSITLSFNEIFFPKDADEKKQRIQELKASIDVLKKQNIELNKSIDDTTKAFEAQEDRLEKQIATYGLHGHALRAAGYEEEALAGTIKKAEAEKLKALSKTLQEKEIKATGDAQVLAMEKEIAIYGMSARAIRDYEIRQQLMRGEIELTEAVKLLHHNAELHRLDQIKQKNDETTNSIVANQRLIQQATISAQNSVLSSSQNIVNGLMSATEKGTKEHATLFAISKGIAVAQAIVGAHSAAASTLAAYASAAPTVALGGPGALIAWNAKGVAMANIVKGLGYANAAVIGATAAQSYDGGGFTGGGSRSGGLDGKGGFPAILHPNETVIDHTKGQGTGGVVVNQTINVTTGVQQTVRAEIQNLMPQIAEEAKMAVANAAQRGGNFARMMS
jgi:hypothetical protein